jgi:hypothetical protein
MVTKEQVTTDIKSHFHYGECRLSVGVAYRRSGQTKTWKTRPNDFRVPVKFGLYEAGEITQDNAHLFHIGEDCPLLGRVTTRRAQGDGHDV